MQNNNFYLRVFRLVLPMALQNLINVGVNATDVIMLGKVSETALSGCSLGGQVLFILNLFLFGMTSGASVLTAQYWGKKDITCIEKVLAITIRISVIVSLIFMIVTLLFPFTVMQIFTNDADIAREGASYLQIVAFTYPLSALTMSYLNTIKSVERVLISTITYASSLLLNIIVNAIFIFGLYGAPKLGIVGAAIGTLCARILEVLIMLFYCMKINREIRIRFSYLLHMDKVLWKDFLYYAGPVIINEVIWGTGYSASSAIVGHLGSSAVAANSVSHVCRQISMVVVFGIGSAAAIMIGKVIGENRDDLAEIYSRRFIKLALIFGVLGSLMIFFSRPFIVSALDFEGLSAEYLYHFLFIMSYYVIGQALNTVIVVGIFRAGGDTKFGLIIDIIMLWFFSIFGGMAAAFVLKLDVKLVYIVLLSDEIIKIPFCFWRYHQKKWLKNITR